MFNMMITFKFAEMTLRTNALSHYCVITFRLLYRLLLFTQIFDWSVGGA